MPEIHNKSTKQSSGKTASALRSPRLGPGGRGIAASMLSSARPNLSSIVVGRIHEFRESYKMTLGEIADVLDVTPRTITRLIQSKKKDIGVSEQKADSLAIVGSIFELGKRVLGSGDGVTNWLRSPVFALDGQKPIDLVKTESGRRKVEMALHQIEHGIY